MKKRAKKEETESSLNYAESLFNNAFIQADFKPNMPNDFEKRLLCALLSHSLCLCNKNKIIYLNIETLLLLGW